MMILIISKVWPFINDLMKYKQYFVRNWDILFVQLIPF